MSFCIWSDTLSDFEEFGVRFWLLALSDKATVLLSICVTRKTKVEDTDWINEALSIF